MLESAEEFQSGDDVYDAIGGIVEQVAGDDSEEEVRQVHIHTRSGVAYGGDILQECSCHDSDFPIYLHLDVIQNWYSFVDMLIIS